MLFMKLRKRLIVDEPVENIEEKSVEKKVTKPKPKSKPTPKPAPKPAPEPEPKKPNKPKKNIKEISIDDLFQKNKKVIDDVDTEYESE